MVEEMNRVGFFCRNVVDPAPQYINIHPSQNCEHRFDIHSVSFTAFYSMFSKYAGKIKYKKGEHKKCH